MEIPVHQPVNRWKYSLHRIFDHPSLALVGGAWKVGKTDFALFLSECLRNLPFQGGGTVISEVASNIDTKGYYPQIYDLVTLRQWLYSSNRRKLFILDELNEHLPGRKSMTSKNVGFMSLIPEISKAHGRLLMIGHQLLTVDKTLTEDVWCRGIYLKTGLKKATLISHLLHAPYNFENIPKTKIPFDPYAVAPLQESPSGKLLFKDKDRNLLWQWSAENRTYKDLGIFPMQLNRLLKKYVKTTLENDAYLKGGLKSEK